MKRNLLFIWISLITSTNLICQETDTLLFCGSFYGYYGFTPEIYLSEESETVRIIDQNFPVVQSLHLEQEIPFSMDTITLSNSADKIIGTYDEKILVSNFEMLNLDTSQVILFSKSTNFIGDSLIDKIEIVAYNNEYHSSPYRIKIYENVKGELIDNGACDMAIGTRPFKIYISKIRYLNMSLIFLLSEGEIPEKSFQLELFHADYTKIVNK